MAKFSAGLLMYRVKDGEIQALLAHPGGPYWRNKDQGAWTIPTGEILPGEDELDAAKREFQEETGVVPQGPFIDLGEVRQKSGKLVRAWAFQGDVDHRTIRSNQCTIEWPPKSGQLLTFEEVDRAEFFDLQQARQKINPAQVAFLETLARHLC